MDMMQLPTQEGSPESLAYLREESLRPVLYCLLAVTFVWYLLVGHPFRLGRETDLWATVFLTIGLIIGFVFRERNLTVASAAIIIGLMSAILYQILDSGLITGLYLLTIVVSLTGLLFDLKTVVRITIMCSLIVMILGRFRWGYMPYAPEVMTPILAIAAVGILSSFAVRNLYLTLHWAWDRTMAAQQNEEILRDRQGELARTLKALDIAYTKLEHLSYDLSQARKEAEEARLVKQQFVTNVSHELRTPLNVIVAFSEMMYLSPQSYDGVTLPVAYRGDVREIYRNSKHLLGLIEDVLDLSQIEAQRLRLYPQPENLEPVITEAIEIVRPLIERQKTVALQYDVPDDLPLVFIDRTRIRQVLVNLLNNARRFTEQGRITVSAALFKKSVIVSVTDTGSGIPEDKQPHVFEEFRQIDGSTTRRQDGTGLGLAICKHFVELHGGQIWLESKGIPGQGSQFCFTLPLVDPRFPEVTPSDRRWLERREPAGRGRTVLLLGGDQRMAEWMEQELEDYWVRPVDEVSTVPDLLDETLARGIIINLAHKKQAWRQMKALRQISMHVPVILCPLIGEREFGKALGVFDYLVKPISADDIANLLDRLQQQQIVVGHVLVVDDDPRMTNLLPRMFRAAGQSFQFMRAHNGQAGLKKMRQQRPDLVLLDLSMPEMDGFAMLERIKADEALCDIPVVLITAYSRTPEEERRLGGKMMFLASQAGFTNEQVLNYVQGILDHAKLPEITPRLDHLVQHRQ